MAKALKLSESSVKRILSNKSLSLERLEEICRVSDISFSEVVKGANLEEAQQSLTMTSDQENALAENIRLLHYYMLLYEGKTPQKIEKEYQISVVESKKYLFLLDRLNLIELHPRDKVKFRNQGFLRFHRDGPIGKALFEQTKTRFLAYNFKPEDYIRFAYLKVSPPTLAKYKTKLERLMMDLQEESRFEVEHNVPTVDTGILLSFRPWQYSYMDALQKKDDIKSP